MASQPWHEVIDLIYEGITTACSCCHKIPFLLEVIDLIYEGITTQW